MTPIPNMDNDQPAEGSRDIIDHALDTSNDQGSAQSDRDQNDDISTTSQAALQETAREHQDTYMVRSDLEDADQRSLPIKEQP